MVEKETEAELAEQDLTSNDDKQFAQLFNNLMKDVPSECFGNSRAAPRPQTGLPLSQAIAPVSALDIDSDVFDFEDAAHTDDVFLLKSKKPKYSPLGDNVPLPDDFLRIQKDSRYSKHMPQDDDGEKYEHGDTEMHAIDADANDCFPNQFIASDEAHDPSGSHDSEQDAANTDASMSKTPSAQVFDSEDLALPDNFLQNDNFLQIQKGPHCFKNMTRHDDGEQYEHADVETHAIDADTSDLSLQHLIAPDEAREDLAIC